MSDAKIIKPTTNLWVVYRPMSGIEHFVEYTIDRIHYRSADALTHQYKLICQKALDDAKCFSRNNTIVPCDVELYNLQAIDDKLVRKELFTGVINLTIKLYSDEEYAELQTKWLARINPHFHDHVISMVNMFSTNTEKAEMLLKTVMSLEIAINSFENQILRDN